MTAESTERTRAPRSRKPKDEETTAPVVPLHPQQPRLGQHKGHEIVQQGAGGIANAVHALRSYLRLNPDALLEIGATGIVCFRFTVNGESYQPVVAMEDKVEWAPKFRFHEAFMAPDSVWNTLTDEANRVMDQIKEAKEREKGVERIAPTDGPTRRVGVPRDVTGSGEPIDPDAE